MKNYNLKFKINKFKYFVYLLPGYWVAGLLMLLSYSPIYAKVTPLGSIAPIPGAYEPKGEGGSTTITTIFSNALAVFTLAAGILFLIYFILAALAWITSSGKPDKVQEAQNKMVHAVIGLIAVVATYGIAFIVGKILGVDFLDPGKYIEKFWG
jgi:hypothetical protein